MWEKRSKRKSCLWKRKGVATSWITCYNRPIEKNKISFGSRIANLTSFQVHFPSYSSKDYNMSMYLSVNTNQSWKMIMFSTKTGNSSFWSVLKSVVLMNFEDKDDFHFFQELKNTTSSTPPSSAIPSRPHFVLGSSTLTILII